MKITQPADNKSTPVVLMLVLREGTDGSEVLLGAKLTGFGKGNIVAPGGKVEPGESSAQAAVRELFEETEVRVQLADAEHHATVLFRFPNNPRLDMDCQVFVSTRFEGLAADSRELQVNWYPLDRLPLAQMWHDSAFWLPRIFGGEKFTSTVILAEDNQQVKQVEIEHW